MRVRRNRTGECLWITEIRELTIEPAGLKGIIVRDKKVDVAGLDAGKFVCAFEKPRNTTQLIVPGLFQELFAVVEVNNFPDQKIIQIVSPTTKNAGSRRVTRNIGKIASLSVQALQFPASLIEADN